MRLKMGRGDSSECEIGGNGGSPHGYPAIGKAAEIVRSVRIRLPAPAESSRSAWPMKSTPSGASTRSITASKARSGRGNQVDQEIAAKDHVVER